MDSISEKRLALVHPVLSKRVHELSDALSGFSFIIRVTQGIRTVAEQDALYAKGRTAPGNKVTDAQGMQSNHVMGFAVDVAPDDPTIPGYQPDWNLTHPSWQKIVELAPTYGLRNGKSWKDEPHLELIEFPTKPTDEMMQIYAESGVQAVWEAFPLEPLTPVST